MAHAENIWHMRWNQLRKRLEQDRDSSGEMMSMAEWANTTSHADQILKYMDHLQDDS